jgi:hypothetical protein
MAFWDPAAPSVCASTCVAMASDSKMTACFVDGTGPQFGKAVEEDMTGESDDQDSHDDQVHCKCAVVAGRMLEAAAPASSCFLCEPPLMAPEATVDAACRRTRTAWAGEITRWPAMSEAAADCCILFHNNIWRFRQTARWQSGDAMSLFLDGSRTDDGCLTVLKLLMCWWTEPSGHSASLLSTHAYPCRQFLCC